MIFFIFYFGEGNIWGSIVCTGPNDLEPEMLRMVFVCKIGIVLDGLRLLFINASTFALGWKYLIEPPWAHHGFLKKLEEPSFTVSPGQVITTSDVIQTACINMEDLPWGVGLWFQSWHFLSKVLLAAVFVRFCLNGIVQQNYMAQPKDYTGGSSHSVTAKVELTPSWRRPSQGIWGIIFLKKETSPKQPSQDLSIEKDF